MICPFLWRRKLRLTLFERAIDQNHMRTVWLPPGLRPTPPISKPWTAPSAPGTPSTDVHVCTRTHQAHITTEMDQHSSSARSFSALVTSDNGITSTTNTAETKEKDKIARGDATGHSRGACNKGRDSGKDTENKQAQKQVKKQEDRSS